MILKARHQGEVCVFELEGHLDFETTTQFKNTCENFLRKNAGGRLVFNLEKLKFVGSSGINQFIKVIKEFNSMETKPKFCCLSSEFQKIFKAYQTSRNPFELFEDEKGAIASFDAPAVPPTIRQPRIKKTPPLDI